MAKIISAAQVKVIAGSGARSDLVAAIVRNWPTAVAKARLTTRNRAAHFLANIMTETGGLRVLSESGAYREKQILKIFGAAAYSRPLGGRGHSAGITPAEAKAIAATPMPERERVLFNRVYGVGNPRKMREFQNTGADDGYKYRGGGMMQATGKSNYLKLEKRTGLPLVAHPELLHQPDSAFMAAYLEWGQDNRANAAADRDDIVASRAVINGGSNGLAECRVFLARAKKALADYDASDIASFARVDIEPEDLQAAEPAPQAPIDVAAAAADPQPQGDAVLLSVQRRLKAMNYNPGIPSGTWGGMTTGAIAGFVNDRGLAIVAPTAFDMFEDVREELLQELARAEAENFVRPVSAERASGDVKVVAAAAPEVVPVRRSFLSAAWAAVVAFVGALWDSVSSYVSSAWDFFTDHKDSLPSPEGSWLSTAWGYISAVPLPVWLVLAGGVFALIAWDAWRGVKKITTAVQTGARQ